jgi:hypothetical protein
MEENDSDFGITQDFKSETFDSAAAFPILTFPTTGPVKSKVKVEIIIIFIIAFPFVESTLGR